MSDRTPVIVGVGLSDYPKAPHLDTLGHHAQALHRVLVDSGVAKGDIDGFVSAGMGGNDLTAGLAEYLGISYRYLDGTMTGGSSFEYHVQHAAAAIREGMCEIVLISYGSDFLSRMGRTLGTGGLGRSDRVSGAMQYEAPFGNTLVGSYAMAARRHMHEFGTTSEQLARDCRRSPCLRRPESGCHVPRSHNGPGCPPVPPRCRSPPQTGLLRRLGRWGRPADHHRGTGPRPASATGLHTWRGLGPDPLEHQPDAGFHHHGGGAVRPGGTGPGWYRRRRTWTPCNFTTASPSQF